MSLLKVTAEFSAEASKDLSSFQHRFMQLDTGGKVTNIDTGGENVTIGTLLNDDADATGKACKIGFGGILKAVAGTQSGGKPNDLLKLAASGKAVKHTVGTGTRTIIVGVAIQDYTTGAIFSFIPAPFYRGEA